MLNYQKISSDLINSLPERTKNVIERRFGLKDSQKESLEKIGKDYGVTRERVRQIELDGLRKIKEKAGDYSEVYQVFGKKINEFGGIKKEDVFLDDLTNKENRNHAFFLLTISDNVHRFSGNKEFHPFWTDSLEKINYAQETINSFHNLLQEKKKPVSIDECSHLTMDQKSEAVLEAAKNIKRNEEGFLGFKNWPEIRPRGNRDKAYMVLRKEGKPLHFTSIAQLIEGSALPQTVHNELIKDARFVLVGRGIYALREWGYEPGEVKDVILDILEKSKKPLSKEEIVDRVLKQRIVKKNTIIQNLSTKKCFVRNKEGKYFINKEL
jgi:predicted Zn-ribbon and HTH transcriptional regulator